MTRTLVILMLLVGMVLPAGKAYAYEWFWGVTYGLAVPSGDTKDYIDSVSWRNFTLEGRKMEYGKNYSFGLSFGWQVMDQKGLVTTELTDVSGTVTGTQFRYLNIWPLLANAHYYFGGQGRNSPIFWLGANAGAYVIEQRTEMGFFAVEENNWHFGGAPEVGVGFPLKGTNLFFLARYNMTTSAGNVSSQQYLTVSVGLGGR